uniref:J domain-containing protein n=1 Tax=Tetraselmis chuii TaxID=63592 RepID=A0A7S1SVE1_9CHLO|mmetsp:Transcript_30183/g.53983  ORF Transcript_30183/g.53983 Transcript_30183/m.53983 type:complete len:204 (+) Transcript_30183:684-1295(+)
MEDTSRKEAQAKRMSELEERIRMADRRQRCEQEESWRNDQGATSRHDYKQAQEKERLRQHAAAEARRAREAEANGARQRPQGVKQASREQSSTVKSAMKRHEVDWERFEMSTPTIIGMGKIPWPPSGEDLLRSAVAMALADSATQKEEEAIKAQYKRLAMRWHPDKFLARFGSGLQDHEREAVLERVKEVQQNINRTYDILTK